MSEITGKPTLTSKVVNVLLTPSLTFTAMVATPCWPLAGVMVIVRLAPLPPRTMLGLPFGTRAVFEEVALTTRLPAAVSLSSTVKSIGPVEPLAGITWPAMREIVGGVFVPATSAKRVPKTRSLT